MVFIETGVFTRRVKKLLDDDSYRLLQIELVQRPTAGDVIPGTGGLRKIRWQAAGKGKRGGARVIYYRLTDRDQILMLLAYGKGEQDSLTGDQKRTLKRLVREELK